MYRVNSISVDSDMIISFKFILYTILDKFIFATLDDREYSGNIIMLLRDASSFVKNHNRKAWNVEGLQRKEFIDYPEGAVREAIVNALVHRDYGIIGSEIHIDMYDDRLEIVSPGGMYDGRNIQEIDIDDLASVRRNPVIADMFSQLDYMERRGSGLRRIKDFFINESYVEFRSNKHNFFVVMKNQYYNENGKLQQEQEELQRETEELQRNEQKLQQQEEKLQQNKQANAEVLNEELLGLCMKVPGTLFKGAFKVLFYFVLPYGVMSTIPTQMIAGTLTPLGFAYGVGIVILFTSFALWLWRLGLKHYKSASS